MSHPSLWCWEIVAADNGRVVESSWATHWVGFESREAGREAGLRRLAALRQRPPLDRPQIPHHSQETALERAS